MNRLKSGAILSALLFSSFTAAMAVDYKYVNPSSTVPAQNQEIASSVGVSEIVLTIPGGELGIETIMRNRLIGITRDGQPYANVSSADVSKVKFAGGSPNEIAICPGLINLPGEYSVSIPAHLVEMAIDASVVDPTVEEGEIPPTPVNAAYTLNFTIVDFPAYDVTPKPGLYQPSGLETFTVSFPEGSVTSAGSSSSEVALYVYDLYDKTLSRQTAYTLIPQGNKMIMKAKNPSAITALTYSISRQWYYLEIPKNAISVNLDGKTMSNPPLSFSKYDVRTVGEDGFTISPAPAVNLLPSDVQEFTLSYPGRYSLDSGAGKVGGIGAFLVQTGNTEADAMKYSGFKFGYLEIISIDEENHIMKLKMKEPEDALAYDNNPSKMETAYYCVSLAPRVLKGKEVLNFPGYQVKGIDACPLTGLRVIVNGQAVDNLTLLKGQSFTGVELFYPFNMKVKDRSKSITISLDGAVQATIPVSQLNIPSNGDKYMMVNFFKTLRTPGDYILNIPAGMFEQTDFGSYLNLEENIKITIPGSTTEVEEIEAAECSEPVYFTLDGRKVSADHLQPGIYVRLQGGKAEKVKI